MSAVNSLTHARRYQHVTQKKKNYLAITGGYHEDALSLYIIGFHNFISICIIESPDLKITFFIRILADNARGRAGQYLNYL